ncbi:hypothetical protein OSH17_03405 [Acinetobacter baumannii]|uniref:hypothetical protein n=1 Tax=Acinetobacter baumannii TaxID=470 RepID=UPI001444B63C|nr:hypothetical protein [Acinetobacter baumannii]EHU1491548.1 hypothetical protein [Acinetobacter baumannii]EIM5577372.1 hypothetical protein [Acinetobacter baumannii]EIO1629091.1 hypothetical protein [Acinetobacter baumannii]EKW4941821.1 hypothetical protein [Acinetobacter baumannii]EKX8587457.1 hypothetical protein [Acinetobacter baumannii]
MFMKNSVLKLFFLVFVTGGGIIVSGCETEQTSQNNSMVGYAQEQAKAQAEFANQQQLEKSSLSEVKVIADGSVQSINTQK